LPGDADSGLGTAFFVAMPGPMHWLGRRMDSPLVEACGLAKTYLLWPEPSDRLIGGLWRSVATAGWTPEPLRVAAGRAAARRGREFEALKNVSFTLGRGESLGVIGRNGSGKSTLLQILAGTLRPTGGTCTVEGRVAALLELGSGFNPEFTGRENVLLQAALHGLGRAEAERRLPEIEDFAGIGQFIDQPVKVYSSGMMVRLAFATQTVLAPDLFIVDEALAVGDVFFQAKCAEFFRTRLARGMALILVSHDLPSVKAFCARTLVLHEGSPAFLGRSDEAISHYHQLHRPIGRPAGPVPPLAASGGATVHLPPGETERNWAATHEVGSREAEIVHCRVVDAGGRPARLFGAGDEVRVEVLVRSATGAPGVVPCLEIANRHRQVVYGVTGNHLRAAPQDCAAGELRGVAFRFAADLAPGDYLIDLALGWGDRGDGAPTQLLHRVAAIASFQVHHDGAPRFFGLGNLRATVDWS
jgi:lipopolysaccharide transport system ATP-binding protein